MHLSRRTKVAVAITALGLTLAGVVAAPAASASVHRNPTSHGQ
jgi:hypothetical protein